MAKKRSSSITTEQRKKARAVVAAVELERIRLKSCTADHNLREGSLPANVENSAEVKVTIDQEARRVHVFPRFHVTARYDDTPADLSPSDMPLFICAEFHVTYAAKSLRGLDSDHLGAFGVQTGLFHVWPYWREFVASVTSRMGFPPLTIPLLSFSQLQESATTHAPKKTPPRATGRRKK